MAELSWATTFPSVLHLRTAKTQISMIEQFVSSQGSKVSSNGLQNFYVRPAKTQISLLI